MVSAVEWRGIGGSASEREADRMRFEHGAGASAIVDGRMRAAMSAGLIDQANALRAVWLALREG